MASTNYEEQKHLGSLIYNNPKVRELISERSDAFAGKMREYDNLSSAQTLEPHLKVQGGSQYKNLDTDTNKQRVLKDIQTIQKEYNKNIEQEFQNDLKQKGYDDELNSIKQYDAQKLIDNEIQINSAQSPSAEYTNSEISNYLEDKGYKEQSKSLDTPGIDNEFETNKRDALLAKMEEREAEIREESMKTKDIDREHDIDR